MAFKNKIKTIQDVLLRDVLVDDFHNLELRYRFIISLICRDWPDIIGSPLCSFTRPIFISKNILHIACSHNGIIQTLNFRSNEIFERLQQYDYKCKIEGVKFIPNTYKK